MEIKEFLSNLEKLNFSLSVKDEKLNLNADRTKVSTDQINSVINNSEIINYIKAHKDELIKYISQIPSLPAVTGSKNVSAIYRLSGLQEGMLFHSIYEEQFGNYIEQLTCDLIDADLTVLVAAWNEVIKRHSVLRSGFYYDSFSIPVQCVYRHASIPVAEMDYRTMDSIAQQNTFDEYVANDRKKGFDLKSPPLMRLGLARLDEHRYRMLWSFHHILFDGWSIPVLVGELLNIYEALLKGEAVTQPAEDKYEDYIRYLERIDKDAEEHYWRSYLQGVTEGSLLPFVKKVNTDGEVTGNFKSIVKILDKAATTLIHNFAKNNRVTINTLMQGAWALLLNRYTNSDNVLYGVVVSGRPEQLPNVEQRVGLFINTIPFTASFAENAEVGAWLQSLQTDQVNSRNYQYTTLQNIKEWTGIKTGLFDTLLVFENYPVNKLVAAKKWSLQVENINVREQTNYPLTILIADADELNFTFNYNLSLLNTNYVQRISEQFIHVLLQITGSDADTLNDVSIIAPEEEKTLATFNDTAVNHPADKTIVSLFEEQAAATPNAVALVFEGDKLTYQQLNERANQLARYLQQHGVGAETLVPICLERSFEMLIGILGILKAGGAYVPVDPEYPQERIDFMLQDSAATILLSNSGAADKLGHTGIQVIALDTDWDVIAKLDSSNLNTPIKPTQLAYAIYTSGSTGKPKGAMNEHAGILNRLLWTQSYFNLTAEDTVLQKTTFCFDVSVWELLWPVIYGAKLVFAKPGAQGDSGYLKDIINREKITLLHFVPSMLNVFLLDINTGDCAGLKNVLCSGEALNVSQLNLFREKLPNAVLHNLYGPTEAAIDVTYWSDTDKQITIDTLPIGKPVWNTQIHIRNKTGELCPVGIPGEICIGGIQVGRGYLNRPELSAEKFITDPYTEQADARLYKTGDLGRWLPDGNVEYLGRIDDQVKIRGYRIELGEIEHVLLQSGLIKQAVVLAGDDKQGVKRLTAYVVAEEYDRQALINYLQAQLPEYMVPQLWVNVDAFPVTSNGKIDKRALTQLSPSANLFNEYAAPRNQTEIKLAEIWKDLLGAEQVGIHDNFFELGGHSLLAMRVVSQLRREMNSDVSIRHIFNYPTIALLSVHVAQQKSDGMPAIIAQQRPEYIPLSYSQERLWFIDRLEGSVQYHLPAVLRLTGKLNVDALEQSFRQIVNRHEVLRTVITEHEGHGYQLIRPAGNWVLDKTTGIQYHNNEIALQAYVKQRIMSPFNLSEDAMLRAELMETGKNEYVLIVSMHHIASDGWSTPILVNELVSLYSAITNNNKAILEPLSIQYADYAIWQRNNLAGEILANKLAYWKQKLDGVAMLNLPADRARTTVQSTNGAMYEFAIAGELSNSPHKLSLQEGTTLYMTMLSVFNVLLYRYSGQTDICVGSPTANRDQHEVTGLIGFFVNTLALRNQVKGDSTFKALLAQVKQNMLEAYDHQDVPFEKVVEAVVKERDLSRSPLFQVMFILQNTPDVPELKLGDVQLGLDQIKVHTSKNDISFNFQETSRGIRGSIEYNPDLYDEATIVRMAGHYNQLLAAVANQPETLVSKLSLLGEDEQLQLQQFNNTEKNFDQHKNIISLFEDQAKLSPDAVAVVFEDESVSYRELNERADQLAAYLQGKGVTNETLVAICVERSVNMLVSILGILKAGGAYVPLDPEYPVERLKYMLEDSGSRLIISSLQNIGKFDTAGIQVIEIDGADAKAIAEQSKSGVEITAALNQLAYVIYTSGSTGQPKGVMVEHGNLLNYCLGFKAYFGVTDTDIILQQSSISFDTLCEEIYPALISSAKIILVKEGGRDVDTIKNFIINDGVTILSTTPSVIEYLNNELTVPQTLRYIISGGEVLKPSFINNLYPDVAIANTYGPSETTVCATYYTIDDAAKASLIGKPVANTSIYIVNNDGALNPVGVAGEIYIGGAQVSRGYLNRAELTAEKFVADTFSGKPGARLYRSGDIGRWLPDGNIEFMGRADDQVKIRGYRIEPGEIENVLLQHPQVKQAVVLAQTDDKGIARLAAYVSVDGEYDKDAITAHVKSYLPEYMVPQLWVLMDMFPLTGSGKIDKRALPAADLSEQMADRYIAPRNETESKLAAIWQELLSVPQVGIHDNFFELGGHSLLAMRVISQVRRDLGIDISVRNLFLYPRIAELTAQIAQQNTEALMPEIKPQSHPEHIPLSYSQDRLWFIDKLEGSEQYHLPGVLNLKGHLNITALEQAIREVVNRHEILRTVIKEHDGRGYQLIKPAGNWTLGLETAGNYTDKAVLKERIDQLILKPFDLSADDMLRADVIRLADDMHVLVINMHHIASDAWSMPVLVNEVVALYNAFSEGHSLTLPDLPLQFADYALWQRSNVSEEQVENKLDYWKSKLQDVPALQLPADFNRPAGGSKRGATSLFIIDKELSKALQLLSKQKGATLYMTLLSVFNVLLYYYSGQDDICIGTSIAGRPSQDLEELIGFFVNTLALRNNVQSNETFTNLLSQVKQTTVEAYNNQEVPFEKVVEAVVKERTAGVSPLFQVMLVLGNTPAVPQLKLGELELSGYNHEYTTVKFDLTFFVTETKEGLQCAVQYSTDLYKSERIDAMIGHFRTLLASVVADPELPVGKLNMLSSLQKEQLILQGRSTSLYPKNKTIADIFEATVLNNTSAKAIVFEGQFVTYNQLNERANRLAHHLQRYDVKAETLVPLYTSRGIDMIVGILGILKAGGAYVPIDTDYPQERIGYILEDTGAKIAVSSSKYAGALEHVSPSLKIVDLDELDWELAHESEINTDRTLSADNLAYVIYTSGSTGKPKGVQVTHGNIIDYVYGLDERTGISACKTFALVSTIATDLGNTVLFSSLLYGGALHVFSKDTVSHIEALHAYFSDNRIDCMKIVPSHWKALSPDEPLVPARMIIFGGEALPTETVAKIWRYSDCRIINHYGPTETTIGKLLYEVTDDVIERIPIGRPFSNTSVYVLNKDMQPCPAGIPGQLFIGGEGLARGYQSQPALTLEKFIADPYNTHAKIYQTGDRVQFTADGNIEYLGRVDDQVKIRGYRVEPGEIGRILESSTLVKQAVVLSRADKQGNIQLIAYVVASLDGFNREEIQAYLKEQLPEYMVPSYIIEVEAIPLTTAGKIDRKALPNPEAEAPATGQVAPLSETEVKLAAIWQDVLEIDNIGVHDDFFALGGHSLLAVRLISAVRKAFTVELPISDVFDHPTIAKLASRLTTDAADESMQGITVQKRPNQIPLSFSQERMWFIDKLEGSVQYHLPAILRLKGTLNADALNYAFRQIINRHEVLRTVIREQGGLGYQYVKPANDWSLKLTPLKEIEAANISLELYLHQQIIRRFDLAQDDMLRAELIPTGVDEHVLLLTMHHIASDGWSTSILVSELVTFYNGYVEGNTAPVQTALANLPIQYADYAIWQREHLQGDLLQQKLSYWKQKLDNAAPLQLPTDYSRPLISSNRGATIPVHINKDLSQQIQTLSRNQGTTLYMTLLSAFKVLLHRYSGQQDICVGTPVSGRNYQETEALIGFFINTLVLRSQVSGNEPFTTLLEQVKNTTLEAYNHQDVPFEKVVEALVKERDMGRSPLFQVMFVFQNTPEIPQLRLGDILLSPENVVDSTSKFDISFNLVETPEGLKGGIEYNTDLFKAETMDRMVGHFTTLLQSVTANPAEPVGSINILTVAEEEEQLITFNNSVADYPTNKSIIDLFEKRVAASPNAVAVEFGEKTLTYQQLNDQSGRLAQYLNANGVHAEALVPICIERGIEMIIGIMGVIKAGGAYVPLDPEYPQDRIHYMLKDTGATIVLSSTTSKAKLSDTSALVIELDNLGDKLGDDNAGVIMPVRPYQLAYIIYTSGSTGKPKGVMVEHKGVVNLAFGQAKALGIKQGTRMLQFASFGFDASCNEIFTTLLSGGCLVMCTKETLLSAMEFESVLSNHKVEITILPPSFQQIVENIPASLKTIISAGEALNETAAKHLQSKGIRVFNGYGPTEGTVCATMTDEPIRPDGTITIGKPIDNVQIYILNNEEQLSPLGVAGEICIGGIQVTRGYLNRDELTGQKFIKNPFSKDPSARLYRTGDLGRWLADGNVEYLGRIDDQVKIRGFRVELGEIENVLLQSGLVNQVVVIAKTDTNGTNRLAAYVVADDFDKQILIAWLGKRLPEYMVPKLWVQMDSFQLTSNGKIDKRLLPDAEFSDMQVYQYVAPRNQLEEKLVAVWQDLLGVEQIGVHDNFFELGGHSILAMRLISAMRKDMGVDISVRELFMNPTIAKLYKQSTANKKDAYQSLIPIRTGGNKTPLYIISGAGGTVFKFKEFVKLLDSDQPVYGLQQPLNIKNPEEFPDTVEGIAERYIAEMVADNPDGPYALSGHCLGGMIAIEVAHQLRAMGKTVSMLAMFDADAKPINTVTPVNNKKLHSLPSILKKSLSVISLKLQFEMFLLLKHPKQALMYKVRKIGPLFSNEESKMGNVEQDIFDKVTAQIKKASDNYQIKPYDGDIVLFNATQQYYFIDRVNKIIYKELSVNYEGKYAWVNYARSVKIHEVKGEHSTIFDQINALEFSKILQQHLDES
jgi:amino acid adenylation domain-containing protein